MIENAAANMIKYDLVKEIDDGRLYLLLSVGAYAVIRILGEITSAYEPFNSHGSLKSLNN